MELWGQGNAQKTLGIQDTKLQCLKKLLFRKHRLTNLEANMVVKLRRIFTGMQKKAHTIYKGTQPYAECQVLTSKFRLS